MSIKSFYETSYRIISTNLVLRMCEEPIRKDALQQVHDSFVESLDPPRYWHRYGAAGYWKGITFIVKEIIENVSNLQNEDELYANLSTSRG